MTPGKIKGKGIYTSTAIFHPISLMLLRLHEVCLLRLSWEEGKTEGWKDGGIDGVKCVCVCVCVVCVRGRERFIWWWWRWEDDVWLYGGIRARERRRDGEREIREQGNERGFKINRKSKGIVDFHPFFSSPPHWYLKLCECVCVCVLGCVCVFCVECGVLTARDTEQQAVR